MELQMNKITMIIRSIVAGAIIAAPLAFNTAKVSATNTSYELSIPVSTVVVAPKGTVREVASKDVASKFVGMTCKVTAHAENQGSVHPDNNLDIVSGNSKVTLKDVERAAGVVTNAEGELTLGNKVVVNLVMGKDGVFSAGMDVKLKCVEEKIDVCRDGVVVTINKSDRKDTDTNAPCPVVEEPKTVKICRDGKVMEVKEDEVKPSDTTNIADCGGAGEEKPKEEPKKEVKAVATTLPNTGSPALGIIVASSIAAGVAGYTAITRKLARNQ